MSDLNSVRIDEPADRILRRPVCRLRGWCVNAHPDDIEKLKFRIGDAEVAWQPQFREDVMAQYPQMTVTGFLVDLDISHYLYAVRSGGLTLTVVVPHWRQIDLQFSVAPGLTASCLAEAGVL